MKRKRWKQGFARLLIMCLLLTQNLTVSAQTVSGGDAAVMTEAADTVVSVSNEEAEAVESEEAVTEEAEAAESDEAVAEEAEAAESDEAVAEEAEAAESDETVTEEAVAEEAGNVAVDSEVLEEAEEDIGILTEIAEAQNAVEISVGDAVTVTADSQNYYKINFTQTGVYSIEGFGYMSIEMYNKDTESWNTLNNFLAIEETGIHYFYIYGWEDAEFSVHKQEAIDISKDVIYSGGIGEETWYKFVPDETRTYGLNLAGTGGEEGIALDGSCAIYDSQMNYVNSFGFYIDTYEWLMLLQKDTVYYIYVNTTDMSIATGYNIYLENELALESVEVLSYPNQDVFYTEYGEMGYGINYIDGIRLKLTLEDGSSVECVAYDEYWSKYQIYDSVSFEYDDYGNCVANEYECELIVDELGTVATFSFTVKSITEETTVWNLGEEKVITYGCQGYKLPISEAGMYKLQAENCMAYFYDSNGTLIDERGFDSSSSQMVSLEAGDYYVMIQGVLATICIDTPEYQTLIIGENYTGEASDSIQYKFTATEKGWYTVRLSSTDVNTFLEGELQILDASGACIEAYCFSIVDLDILVALKADMDYVIALSFNEYNAAADYNLIVEKEVVTDLTSDNAETVEITDEADYFSFTPAEDGAYDISISKDDTNYLYAYVEIKNEEGMTIACSSFGGDGDWTLQLQLESGVTYCIIVEWGATTEFEQYQICVTKGLAIVGAEIIEYPEKPVGYTELGADVTRGLRLKLLLEDGTSVETVPNDKLWIKYDIFYGYQTSNGEAVEWNDYGNPVAGDYVIVITCAYGDLVSYDYTYISVFDEEDTYEIGTSVTPLEGTRVYKVNIAKPGFYTVTVDSYKWYSLYDSQLNMVDSGYDSFFYIKESGDYYILFQSYEGENENFTMNEKAIVELTTGTTYDADIAELGTEAFYKVVPEVSGVYNYITISQNDNCRSMCLWDEDLNEISNIFGGGSELKTTVQLEAGKTYYLWIRYDEDTSETSYQVLIEKAVEVTSVELIQKPYRSKLYYGIESPDFVMLRGFKLGVTLDNGEYIEFYESCPQWDELAWTWEVYTSTGEYAYTDNSGYYPVGEYYVHMNMGGGSVGCDIPFSIVPAEDMDKELTVDQPVEGLFGTSDILVYDYIRVEITEAGTYQFVASADASMSIFSVDNLYLTGGWGSVNYKFAEAGTYYMRTACYTDDYSISMEKMLEVVKIDLSYAQGNGTYYYLMNQCHSYQNDIKVTLTMEDGSVVEFSGGTSDWYTYDLNGMMKDPATGEGASFNYTDQCYNIGEYVYEVSCGDVTGTISMTVKDLKDFDILLTEQEKVTFTDNIPTDGSYLLKYAKVYFPEAGSYRISNTIYSSYWFYDDELDILFSGYGRSFDYQVDEPGYYYLRVSYRQEEITLSMEKIIEPVSVEVTSYQKNLYNLLAHNSIYYAEFIFDLTLEDGTVKKMRMYDNTWYEYNFQSMVLLMAEDEPTRVDGYSMPVGEYQLWVYNDNYGINYYVPFTVSEPDSAPEISVDVSETTAYEYEVYQIDIPESGIYKIMTPDGTDAYCSFFDTEKKWVAGATAYNNQKVIVNLEAGHYYFRINNYDYPENITFTISKMPDITALSHDKEEKLEITYGTWGYYFANTVSGNKYTVGASGNSTPVTPGALITGQVGYTDASGNSIVSGNNVYRERFYFDVTVSTEFEDGTKEDIYFNSKLWDVYGFIEKVFNLDGSAIYADENGYAAIGDYTVEFEAQGESVQIPFSVVESDTMRDIRKAEVSFEKQVCSGEALKPIPTVRYGEDALTVNEDYTIEYADNIEAGTARAILTGIGGYSGVLSVEFEIVEKEQNRADIAEEIPSEVLTDTVKEATGCDTVEDLKSYLEEAITTMEEATQKLPNVKKEDTKVIDIIIEVSFDGGYTWEEATPENFPDDGVDVVIPYPEGTGKDSHDFVIGHLMTSGPNAGQMEFPDVEKCENGLRIHIHSASPFAIGWTEIFEGNPFADVKETSWQYTFVKFAVDNGLMKGKGNDASGLIIFDPENNMTRAEFVQTLYNKEGKPAVEYTDKFADVPDGKWYTNAILWAAENNIVAGKGDIFDVNGYITRQEMATILYKYATNFKGYETSGRAEFDSYTDADSISGWATENMKWALNYGIMKGKGERIAPLENATRAECATMLKNFMAAYE